MNYKYIELGKRAFTAIVIICFTLIVLVLALSSYQIIMKTSPIQSFNSSIQDKQLAYQAYIKKYMPLAVQEEELYGIPAKITIAQALLESNAGRSILVRENNNHFGIKCFSKSCEKGHCSNYKDDSHKDFFRKYKSVEDSYRDHSKFLMKDRYKHLLSLPKTDLKGWAKGIQQAGYATDKRYATKLLSVISKV